MTERDVSHTESPRPAYPWTLEDANRALGLYDDGAWKELLPVTRDPSPQNIATWDVYESVIHIVEQLPDEAIKSYGGEFEDEMFRDVLDEVDWLEIKIFLQKANGEEPEEYDDELKIRFRDNRKCLRDVREFFINRFGSDFGLPDDQAIEDRKLFTE